MKTRQYLFVIFLLHLFVNTPVFSQQSEYITGKLFDSKSNEPVVFANVRIKDRAVGIITNVDGSFRIPLLYKEYGDIIEISSMGYETKEIPIAEFTTDKLNIIKLEPAAIDLQEAVVKGKRKRNITAKQIVQKAIDNITRNYPSTSFSTIGYYRDYQYKDETYINLNEGILEVFDQGFDQLDDATSETRLFNFGLNKSFEQDSMARTAYDYITNKKVIRKAHLDAYGGNEFRILRIHDAIRNYNVGSFDFIGTLKTDLLKNHSFLRSADTQIENEAIYNIKFRVIYLNFIAHGNIYISKANYAIHRLEYTLYDGRKKNKKGEKNRHGHRQKVIFEVKTDYKKIEDKMYLNYISFHNSFEIRKPPKFKLDSILVNAPDGSYQLYFNQAVDTISAKKYKNYNIIYKERKFDIRRVVILENRVTVYPDKKFKAVMVAARGELNTLVRRNKDPNEIFEIKVKNIKDVHGNVVDEPDIDDYHQYREFFVQRVKPDSRAPLNSLFMDKRKPIFDNQPMIKPKDYKEYWMNTPLQGKIN